MPYAPFVATKSTYTSRGPEIAARLSSEADDALREGAEAIAQSAKDNIDDITGDLANSIEVIDYHGLPGTTGYRVVATKFYAPFLEFGTEHADWHPFLMPAFDEHVQEILDNVSDAVD